MQVLLLTATFFEMRPLLRAQGVRALWLGAGRSVQIIKNNRTLTAGVLGMGPTLAGRNCEKFLGQCRPQKVVLAGFSGGVRKGQSTGDIALPAVFSEGLSSSRVPAPVVSRHCEDSGEYQAGRRSNLTRSVIARPEGPWRSRFLVSNGIATAPASGEGLAMTVSTRFTAAGLRSVPVASNDGLSILTENRQISVSPLAGPDQKAQIGEMWPDACGVDMESYTVAKICSDRNIPFSCIRVIFDEVDQHLPSLWRWRTCLEIPQWYIRYRRAADTLSAAVQAANIFIDSR